jgi:hypothetical protein
MMQAARPARRADGAGVVTKIVALVKAGEVDPDRMCSRVLFEMAAQEAPPAE